MRKQRCLLLIDEAGESAAHLLSSELTAEHLPVQMYTVTPNSLQQPELFGLLSSQWIGTYLYLLVSWPLLEPLRELAEQAGFSEYEMECRGIGQRSRPIFCAACQKITLAESETVITCRFCREKLSVSDHYSKRLQAYLGYTTLDSLHP